MRMRIALESRSCKNKHGLWPVSRKSRELFGPEKPFVKLRPAYSVKLVFSYVVKGIKIKIIAKFRASRRLRFEKFRDFRDTRPLVFQHRFSHYSSVLTRMLIFARPCKMIAFHPRTLGGNIHSYLKLFNMFNVECRWHVCRKALKTRSHIRGTYWHQQSRLKLCFDWNWEL